MLIIRFPDKNDNEAYAKLSLKEVIEDERSKNH